MMRRTTAPLAATLVICLAAGAAPARAGILIDASGTTLTAPDRTLASGGGPATGFRRFGRNGYFATPRDPGLPFHGRTAYGAAGRRLDNAIRADRGPRQPGDSIFTGALRRWFE